MGMTEQEWMRCDVPQLMLESLSCQPSERKSRLLAASWCRCFWHLLENPRTREAVEIAEKYADGFASAAEMNITSQRVFDAYVNFRPPNLEDDRPLSWKATSIAIQSTGFLTSNREDYLDQCVMSTSLALRRVGLIRAECGVAFEGWEAAAELQRVRLLDVLGNPYRTVDFDYDLLGWRCDTIPDLAQAIYEERNLPDGTLDNARLAVLVDALEEAGCTNADILDHCRKPGVHVRGCWVIDLLLGKQ